MPLLMTTGPVEVLAYGTYNGDDGQPMHRKDGSPVEFVDVGCDEYEPRRFTLDASVNGSRSDVGALVSLTLDTNTQPEPRTGRSGRPYVKWVEKRRVVKFTPAGR